MANTLRFKRGLVSGIPTALAGEPLFTTDTFDLYIGNGTTNTRFQKYIASGTTSQLLRGDGSLLTMPIVLTSPANGEVLKYNGTNWVNSSDAGVTGSGAAGQVTYWNGTGTITGSNNLFWDATNSRLGIGTASPQNPLHINGVSGNAIVRWAEASTTRGFIGSSNGLIGGQTTYFAVRGESGLILSGQGNAINLTVHPTSGNIIINNGVTDNGLRFQVTGDGYFSGSVGIGTTGLSNTNLNITKNLTGLANVYGIFNSGSIRSDVTTGAQMFTSAPSIQNAVFTLSGLKHFEAVGISSVGSATITSQFGFYVESLLTGATNNYGFFSNIASGTGRWNLYMNGTARNYLAGNTGIGTNNPLGLFHVSGDGVSYFTRGTKDLIINPNVVGGNTVALIDVTSGMAISFGSIGGSERMRIDASGNLGLGVTPSAWGSSYKAIQINSQSSFSGFNGNFTYVGTNLYIDGSDVGRYITTGATTLYRQSNGAHAWFYSASGTAGNAITFTQAMTLDASGNLGIGTTNPIVKLHAEGTNSNIAVVNVVGTAPNYIFDVRDDGVSQFRVFPDGNVGIGTGSTNAGYKLDVNGTMRVSGASTLSGGITLGHTGGVAITFPGGQAFRSNGGIFIDYGNGGSGDLVFRRGAGVTSTLTLAVADGAATFSSTAQAAGFITSGGTGYAVINSASNTVTALRPTGGGSSIMSTNSNGLHIAVGTQAAGDLILASNNTERIRLSSNGFFSQLNATNPSASITDSYIQYSADVVAGNAAPHFRTENGAVIKLYQETTAVGNAIFSQGGGNAVLDDSTFAGYTLRQIVQALRNQGILQ